MGRMDVEVEKEEIVGLGHLEGYLIRIKKKKN